MASRACLSESVSLVWEASYCARRLHILRDAFTYCAMPSHIARDAFTYCAMPSHIARDAFTYCAMPSHIARRLHILRATPSHIARRLHILHDAFTYCATPSHNARRFHILRDAFRMDRVMEVLNLTRSIGDLRSVSTAGLVCRTLYCGARFRECRFCVPLDHEHTNTALTCICKSTCGFWIAEYASTPLQSTQTQTQYLHASKEHPVE